MQKGFTKLIQSDSKERFIMLQYNFVFQINANNLQANFPYGIINLNLDVGDGVGFQVQRNVLDFRSH